jgi:hypothetical protein
MNIQRPAAAPRVANSRYTLKLLLRLPRKRPADAEVITGTVNNRRYKILANFARTSFDRRVALFSACMSTSKCGIDWYERSSRSYLQNREQAERVIYHG